MFVLAFDVCDDRRLFRLSHGKCDVEKLPADGSRVGADTSLSCWCVADANFGASTRRWASGKCRVCRREWVRPTLQKSGSITSRWLWCGHICPGDEPQGASARALPDVHRRVLLSGTAVGSAAGPLFRMALTRIPLAQISLSFEGTGTSSMARWTRRRESTGRKLVVARSIAGMASSAPACGGSWCLPGRAIGLLSSDRLGCRPR